MQADMLWIYLQEKVDARPRGGVSDLPAIGGSIGAFVNGGVQRGIAISI
jgi:hypothetical protein